MLQKFVPGYPESFLIYAARENPNNLVFVRLVCTQYISVSCASTETYIKFIVYMREQVFQWVIFSCVKKIEAHIKGYSK